MFGLILDFHWKAAFDPNVVVTLTGSVDQLRHVPSVDTRSSSGNWPRSEVVPIETRTVTSQFSGGELVAFICTRRESDS